MLPKHMIGVVPSPDIYPAYLAYCITAARQELLQRCLKDIPHAREMSFRALCVQRLLVPPYDVQRRIVDTIRNEFCNREAEACRSSLLHPLKEGGVREEWKDSSDKEVGDEILMNWQRLLDEDEWLAKTLFDELARQMEQAFAKLGKPRPKSDDDWPLRVDVEAGQATLRGEVHHLDELHVLILDVLNKSRGHPLTRRKMRGTHDLLKDEEHLDRIIKKIPPPFRDLIKSSEEGYWLDLRSLE